MTRSLSREDKLALALLKNTPVEDRCPHLAQDVERLPYCAQGLGNKLPSFERYNACEPLSLQMWCLDRENCTRCVYYPPK
ncbi:MAG: hypothetical protein AABX53_03725 [Nanoarchaeota archaeon]